MHDNKVVLVTGSGQRVGADIVRHLHQTGWTVLIHYRHSQQAALNLAADLNQQRPHSAYTLNANLDDLSQIDDLVKQIYQTTDRLDALVNNASTFYATPIGNVDHNAWHDLFSSNAKAPFFLSQACVPLLKKTQGCIVNIIDIHAQRPFKNYTVYCMAKAALQTMTYALAKELAPDIRVNGVAPGAILWPEMNSPSAINNDTQAEILAGIPLKRSGSPQDIAKTVRFLVEDAPYITGQIIAVDGGRSHTLGVE